MPRKKNRTRESSSEVGEEIRIAVQLAVKKFLESHDEGVLEFPSSLNSHERKFVHRWAAQHGLQSKSRGMGQSRFLTVYKEDKSTIMHEEAALFLTEEDRKLAVGVLTQHPVTTKERQDLLPPFQESKRPKSGAESTAEMGRAMGKLNGGIPQVPPPPLLNSDIESFRKNLPVWKKRSEILRSIAANRVTLITGETGSGKTSQVPQYIMESALESSVPCRVVCTEPRRIAAVAMAERVACERGDRIGQTVGFQIRLESRVSPKTVLTFCTNGVLLRTLMGGGTKSKAFSTITHVIIDEVHERDRLTDFLLAVARDILSASLNARLILMSATADVELFMRYFAGSCNHVVVPGRNFPVKELYLEDILLETKFTTPKMVKNQALGEIEMQTSNLQPVAATDILASLENLSCEKSTGQQVVEGSEDDDQDIILEMDGKAKTVIDKCLYSAFLEGNEQAFSDLLSLYFDEDSISVPVDYAHSTTGVTALMCAAGRSHTSALEQLLMNGADPTIRAKNGWSAADFAAKMGFQRTVDFMASYHENVNCRRAAQFHQNSSLPQEWSREKRLVLSAYHRTFDDEDSVNRELIAFLVRYLVRNKERTSSDPVGAVLVFLPGYEDIVDIWQMLRSESRLLVLMVHSQVASFDQRKIFNPPPPGMTKVILATNIAETSITIDDITHVIDSGKVKEKNYDSLSDVSCLKTTWISQSSASQRKGRAGRLRPGVCFRLYSSNRASSLYKAAVPEILRTPLMELCLATKLLAPENMQISDFLAKAPEPPSLVVTRAAVQSLKTIEALDEWENVTELGNHLLDLPVEPKLGKMVVHGVVLKCLDPILTIVCCASGRDPFTIPTDAAKKRSAKLALAELSENSMSDHMTLLRAFQGWQRARSEGNEELFCRRHQISSSTLEMVAAMRTQLLGQLRASGFVRAKGSGDIRDLNRNSENWAVVKAALLGGAYPSLARYDETAKLLRTSRESRVRLHPRSVLVHDSAGVKSSKAIQTAVLDALPTDWLMFAEMNRAGKLVLIKGVTAVSPIAVAIFAGAIRLPPSLTNDADAEAPRNVYLEETSDSEVEDHQGSSRTALLRLDDWVVFRSDVETANVVLKLRQKWGALLLRRMKHPSKAMTLADDTVLQTLVNILTNEEQALGLTQPCGIGQRPKPLGTESYGCSSSPSTVSADGSPSPSTGCSSSPASSVPSLSAAKQPSQGTRTKYFVVKAGDSKSLEVSATTSFWQLSGQTERKLLDAVISGYKPILIFSVQGSGHFQGFARFTGLPEQRNQGSGAPFHSVYWIEWLRFGNVPFQETMHLLNSLDENNSVQMSKDGQEIEAATGEALCSLWGDSTLKRRQGNAQHRQRSINVRRDQQYPARSCQNGRNFR